MACHPLWAGPGPGRELHLGKASSREGAVFQGRGCCRSGGASQSRCAGRGGAKCGAPPTGLPRPPFLGGVPKPGILPGRKPMNHRLYLPILRPVSTPPGCLGPQDCPNPDQLPFSTDELRDPERSWGKCPRGSRNRIALLIPNPRSFHNI